MIVGTLRLVYTSGGLGYRGSAKEMDPQSPKPIHRQATGTRDVHHMFLRRSSFCYYKRNAICAGAHPARELLSLLPLFLKPKGQDGRKNQHDRPPDDPVEIIGDRANPRPIRHHLAQGVGKRR